ncbi:MAG: hypothetical protein ACRDJF_03615 [Actinomycetota bacterium]
MAAVVGFELQGVAFSIGDEGVVVVEREQRQLAAGGGRGRTISRTGAFPLRLAKGV